MELKTCPQCGQPMTYGPVSRCRVCTLAARRATYRRHGSRPPGDPRKELVEAARKGDLTRAKQVLGQAPFVASGSKALTAAAKHGHPDLVELLLASSPDSETIQLALHAAIAPLNTVKKTPGHRTVVELLLARELDAQIRARVAAEMLCLATEAGSHEIIDLLLEQAPRLDIFTAAALGQVERVHSLLEHDPGLARAEDHHGMTALHRCVHSALGKTCHEMQSRLREVAELLIARGADVNRPVAHDVATSIRLTPLAAAAWHGGDSAMVRLLLSHGADARAGDNHALWFALGHYQGHGRGHYGIAAILLHHGADINARGGGRTILHALAHHSDARGVEWLLNHGADVNARSDRGRTPLHEAAERNDSPKVVQLLLASGADVNPRDVADNTTLQYAELNGKQRTIPLLQHDGTR